MSGTVASDAETSTDELLLNETIRVSSLLGRYAMSWLDADRAEFPPGDESMLADRLAAMADAMRARVTRRSATALFGGQP